MKVSIESKPDGTYLVSDEAQEEAAEGQAESSEAPGMAAQPQAAPAQGQMANSLQDALQMVVQLFKSQPGGQTPSPFEQGFKQGMQPPTQ